jgi:two-component system cell cycle response regulator
LVAILQKGIREIDILARYGGEEFISILPGTAWEQALVVAQRMKTQVACAVFNTGGEAIHLTVSVGVSYLPHAEIGSPEDLIKRGDQALYLAKRGGRNQVALSPHTDAFIESGREVNE